MMEKLHGKWIAAWLFISMLGAFGAGGTALRWESQGNRFTYLDENDPFYPHGNFPRLTTPQWVGEPGVEAVVVLAIDDMRDPARYEKFLRPILERLKKIDGRAPVSIMVNSVSPADAQLQTWLKEGLSLDVHTIAHPCPLLAKGNFDAAADTYHACVDLMNEIPGNKPIAFRMPCCDSMNSPSPRFYAEVFTQVSSKNDFLTIDSSVMNIFTGRELNGRFSKYLPKETNAVTRVSMKSFVTTIENYPYPYVIGKLCWEFPATAPSDWEAHNLHGSTNPVTVADWKAALDITVAKQGVFNFIFHPHGWITSAQMNDFIDYAVEKHGKKVKFLTFAEAQARLDKSLLADQPLRSENGGDNGVRILDLNSDGYQDVVIANSTVRTTRVWDPQNRKWHGIAFPVMAAGARFGVLGSDAVVLAPNGGWRFKTSEWKEDKALLKGLKLPERFVLRDVNRDGSCELVSDGAVYEWAGEWKRLAYTLPKNTRLGEALRFVDVNGDGYDDVLFSDDEHFSLHQFVPKPHERLSWKVGWNDEVFAGKRGDQNDIPRIARGGKHPNNGVWFKNATMWIQNEDTAHLPDKVHRRSFKQLLSADDPLPKTPQESLASIKVRPGFVVELVAAEPLVLDPIAFDWTADGRLWVVQMGDYPLNEKGGEVRVLDDANDDGRYDKSTVFLDNLNFPTGVMPWRKGVIVSAAPDILYAEDTDNDGKADMRQVLFTGFTEGNPQHLVNGFDYGLDHWIYGANGDSGGVVGKVNISGQDFRFRPDERLFEAIEGQTQYGRHRDDWGNWFGNNNPTWLWHYFLPARYAARNPSLPVRTNKRYLTDSTRLYPVTRIRQRFNDPHQAGHVTSGNSPTPYRDEVFGSEFDSSVFISDPVHNLVHREILEPDGVSFRSRRAADESESEFLASADFWFRPTMMRTGPDGALYLADMYRLVLEHPEWITKDILARLDTRAGEDKGRIYRVFPQGVKLRTIPRLDRLATAELVRALDHPNGWQRDTAQRLLLHAKEETAIPLLRELLQTTSRPQTRIHVLYTLQELAALTPALLDSALANEHPRVREHAIRLYEPFLRNGYTGRVLDCVDDTDLRVVYQLAFTLGESRSPEVAQALMRIVQKHGENSDVRLAVLSSAVSHAERLVRACESLTDVTPGLAAFIEHVSQLAPEPKLLESKLPLFGKFAAAAGLLESSRKPEPRRLEPIFVEARRSALDRTAPEPFRLAALKLLGRSGANDAPALAELLSAHQLPRIQRAALNALARSDSTEVLISHWKSLSPALRSEALATLLSRSDRAARVVEALESGTIHPGEMSVAQQNQLLKRTDPARVERIFAARERDRSGLVQKYSEMKGGDPRRGAELFTQHCATCHRFKGEGSELGPDLGMVANKSVDVLLTAILDPNRAMESRYLSYNLTTKDGDEYSGLLAAENANSITLRSAGGVEKTFLRTDVRVLSSSGLSAMPEGLETALPPNEMAHLVAFILAE